ncbi:MAG: DUF167 domain-containing protein [Candidatus Nanopelagicales bacterium]
MDQSSHADRPEHGAAAQADEPFWKVDTRGTILSVHLTPRSSREQVTGCIDGWLKVKVTAPPTDAKANDALIKFLAKQLGVAPSKLSIIRGHKSRNKAVLVASHDVDPQRLLTT